MTLALAFLCSDGIVFASDSMVTNFISDEPHTHRHGKKVHLLKNKQLFAYAGDRWLSDRIQNVIETTPVNLDPNSHPINHTYAIRQNIVKDLASTQLQFPVSLEVLTTFSHNNNNYCCCFDIEGQPKILNEQDYYMTIGTGSVLADPFLLFLIESFCPNGPPNVVNGIILGTWIIDHVVKTNPGGVGDPIQIMVLEKQPGKGTRSRIVTKTEIDEYLSVIKEVHSKLPELVQQIKDNIDNKHLDAMPSRAKHKIPHGNTAQPKQNS